MLCLSLNLWPHRVKPAVPGYVSSNKSTLCQVVSITTWTSHCVQLLASVPNRMMYYIIVFRASFFVYRFLLFNLFYMLITCIGTVFFCSLNFWTRTTAWLFVFITWILWWVHAPILHIQLLLIIQWLMTFFTERIHIKCKWVYVLKRLEQGRRLLMILTHMMMFQHHLYPILSGK